MDGEVKKWISIAWNMQFYLLFSYFLFYISILFTIVIDCQCHNKIKKKNVEIRRNWKIVQLTFEFYLSPWIKIFLKDFYRKIFTIMDNYLLCRFTSLDFLFIKSSFRKWDWLITLVNFLSSKIIIYLAKTKDKKFYNLLCMCVQ